MDDWSKPLKHSIPTSEFHDALIQNPDLWDRLTMPCGMLDDGDYGMLELATCRVCLSTISRKVPSENP